jgi:hypothetical protein
MKFRTELSPTPFIGGINLTDSKLLMLGSCFTDEVGARLQADGFDATVNPTGTLYNPLSVARTLRNFASERQYTSDDLFENQRLWRSFDHHSRLADADREMALRKVNEAMRLGRDALFGATHIIITLGTAYVFEHDGEVVCNCHKMPAAEFVRRRLDISEIVRAWQPIIEEFSSEKKFIFTVSPIRHVADGLHGNQLSKATLLLGVEQLGVEYFPAYEAVIDDLRDYRFFADDMVHPSKLAVDYVYELFTARYCTAATMAQALVNRKQSLRSAHRPLH